MSASAPVSLLSDQMVDMKFITAFTGLTDSPCHSDGTSSLSQLFNYINKPTRFNLGY